MTLVRVLKEARNLVMTMVRDLKEVKNQVKRVMAVVSNQEMVKNLEVKAMAMV